ncbi:MAG: hypothetical protein JWQ07_4157 [Ramlibacter sp.]|nr:hypothetical protein [Ramlibacter sp.]
MPNHRLRIWLKLSCLSALLGAAAAAHAQTPPPPAEPGVVLTHPWVVPPPRRQAEVYFPDLKDGDTRETPFVLRFGLSMRGIAPAEIPAGQAGHHHLLIDQPLPLDFKKPLPFTEHYIHFGKGEMQALIDLKPGTYQFNLVLADKDHIPYFVFGKPVKVTVTKQNKGVNLAKLFGPPRVEIRSPAEGDTVRGPFRVNFHASGYNVAPEAANKLVDAGHFRLAVEPAGKTAEILDFRQGQTEVWLNPPRGSYTLRLDFLSNVKPDTVVTAAPPLRITVSGTP